MDLVLEHELVDLGDSNGVDDDGEDESIEESRRQPDHKSSGEQSRPESPNHQALERETRTSRGIPHWQRRDFVQHVETGKRLRDSDSVIPLQIFW